MEKPGNSLGTYPTVINNSYLKSERSVNSEKINILGVNIHVVNIKEIIRKVDEKIRNNDKGYITITGVHGIMEAQRSAIVKSAHQQRVVGCS